MSDTTLSRIGELEQKLAPLGQKVSGMPVEAADWNALVATMIAVLGIDRLQEDSTRALLANNFAPKEHQHVGAVTIEWLDNDLRTRIGAGGTAVAMQRSIDLLQKQVETLTAEVNRLRTSHSVLQASVDTFSVNDVERAKSVRTLTESVGKLGELGTQVQGLGRDFTALQGTLNDVRDLRGKLLDETGKPIDFLGIRNDVRDLQALGENLKDTDGKPIRVRDLALQLREVKDVSGVGEGLDVRFTKFAAETQVKINNTVAAQVKGASDTLAAQQKEQIAAGVKSAVDAASSAQTSALDQRVAQAETRITASISTTLGKQLRDEQAPLFKAMDDKLAQIEPRVAAAVNAAKPDIAASVEASVRPKITNDLQLVINRATTDLGTRATVTEAAVNDLKTKLPANVAAEVQAQTGALSQALGDQVKQQVDSARTSILGTIPAAVDRATTGALANLDQRIAAAVTTNVGDLPKRVRDEVVTQTKTLHTDIEHEVAGQLGAANIAGQVTNAAKSVSDQLTAAMTTRFTAERAQTVKDLTDAKSNLQRQIVAEAANEKNAAVTEARNLVEALRVDSKKNFDSINAKLVTRSVVTTPVVVKNP
jgi:hypothetical protein